MRFNQLRFQTECLLAHILFFKEGITLLENMELRELAHDQVYEFLYLNLNERIKGATGSPVRAIAIR